MIRPYRSPHPVMKMTMPAHQPTSTRNTSITNTVGKAGTTTDRCAGKLWRLSANGSKETYPRYKFSVTQNGYRSINIYLIKADFEAFTKESGLIYKDINHYHIGTDRTITERAREVMLNVCDFTMSYNYDNSDVMTDYFDTNFYLTLGIGRYDKALSDGTAEAANQR